MMGHLPSVPFCFVTVPSVGRLGPSQLQACSSDLGKHSQDSAYCPACFRFSSHPQCATAQEPRLEMNSPSSPVLWWGRAAVAVAGADPRPYSPVLVVGRGGLAGPPVLCPRRPRQA